MIDMMPVWCHRMRLLKILSSLAGAGAGKRRMCLPAWSAAQAGMHMRTRQFYYSGSVTIGSNDLIDQLKGCRQIQREHRAKS